MSTIADLAARYSAGSDEPVTSDVPHVPHVPVAYGEDGTELGLLLDQLDELFGRYVAFPSDEARWATVGWVAHCHAIPAFESTPRLALLSAEKGSGKTRTLEVIELVVPNPLHTVNVSAAALFRKVSQGACTLLLDEADTYLGLRVAQQHEELRGLVNAGHRRGAVAYRCVIEKGVKVEEFPAFAPVALAGIGDLPDTILDRSIAIGMKRRAPTEHVEPFRRRRVEQEATELRDWLASWADRNMDKLSDLEPDMPGGIVDRPADVWEPLVMLGDYAGGTWAERLRAAATRLNRERIAKDPSLGVQLLGDARAVFGDDERITTEQLLERLIALDESPWGDLRGQELDSRGLARRLRPFEVRPGKHRFGDVVKKGYKRSDFHDAWIRYLPDVPSREDGGGGVVSALATSSPLHPPSDGEQGEQGQQVDTDEYEARHPDLFEATR